MRRSQTFAVLGAVVLGMSLLAGPAEARRDPRPDRVSPQPTVSAPQPALGAPPTVGAANGSDADTGGSPHDDDIAPGPVPPPRAGPVIQADSTWRVDSLGDSASGSCGPSPINGTCTLRAALVQANNTSGVQTVVVPIGTFKLTLAGNDDTGQAGDLDIVASRTIVIKGQGPANTTIDANSIDRVFDVQPNATLTLSDLKIMGGVIAGASGGGVRNRGTTTLENVHVVGNIARASGTNQGDGGGVANLSGGILTINNSQITSNVAVAVNGVGGYGGGVGNFAGTAVTITNTDISFNTAGLNGGGIAQNNVQGNGQFTDNSAITLINSIVSNNAAIAGGGIVSGGTGTTTVNLTSTTVSGNQATSGGGGNGGGITMANQNGTLRVTNSTISNNVSPTSNNQFAGGGIRIGGPSTAAIITSSTIINNAAFAGGGISSAPVNGIAASVSVSGSVFANNTGGNCSTTYGGTDNAEGSTNTCGFTFPNLNTGLSTGTPVTTEGFTPVFVPPTNSPLVDAATSCSGPTVDQRGVTRPQTFFVNKCDVGSVEIQPDNFNCATPSRLKVVTTKQSTGVLLVTVSTNNASNQIEVNNRIKAFTLGLQTNGVVLPSRPVTGGTQLTFRIIRPASLTADGSGAGTVSFTLTDRCGDYKSFAGGGPNAW